MILKGSTAVDRALAAVTRNDAFVDQIMRDFRKITPEVGTSVASLYSEAMERAVRLPKGERRVVGQIALNLSACASLTAALLDEIGDMSGDRHEAAAQAFRALLKEAQSNVVSKKLDKIIEGHA
jgi:hypothetical protein